MNASPARPYEGSWKLPTTRPEMRGIEESGLRLVTQADQAATLLASWVGWMLAGGLSKRTAIERARVIRRLAAITGTHPLAFHTDELIDYLGGLQTASTRCAYYGVIRSWHSWLVRTDRRPDDPSEGLRAPKQPINLPHPVATPHLERILATRMHRRTKVMILLGAYQGLRVHEIAKIRGEDVDPVGGSLYVVGKGGQAAMLPLHPVIATLAADMPARGWWFPSPTRKGEPVRPNSVSAMLSDVMRRARVPGSAHSLRHWFGTELIRSGSDARTAQTLLRHRSLQTTAIYTAIADDQREAAILRLPRMRRTES